MIQNNIKSIDKVNKSQNSLCESVLNKDEYNIILNEKIVKKGNKWQVQSEKGKNLGTYDTKEEAEKRLKQVEYFKHMNEEYVYYDSWTYGDKETKVLLTKSVNEIKNKLINIKDNEAYRIVYDANIDLYMLGNADDIIHADLVICASNEGYYKDPFEGLGKKVGQYMDSANIYCYIVSAFDEQSEKTNYNSVKDALYFDSYYNDGKSELLEYSNGLFIAKNNKIDNKLKAILPLKHKNLEESNKYVTEDYDRQEKCLLYKTDSYTKEPKEGKLRLYHQTNKKNINSIFDNGLLVNKAKEYDNPGDVVWFSDINPFENDSWHYGDCLIEVDLPENYEKLYKRNWHEYTCYKDIPVEYINAIYLQNPYRKEIMKDFQNTRSIEKSIERFQSGQLKEDLEMSNEYDSEGNQLTKAQAEFFKNSKVRDNNGKLIPVYHSSYESFNEFRTGNLKWFAEDKNYAEGTFGDGNHTYTCYLNITNPLKVNKFVNVDDWFFDEDELTGTDDLYGKDRYKAPLTYSTENLFDSLSLSEEERKAAIDEFIETDANAFNLLYYLTNSVWMRNKLVEKGYDGLIVEEGTGITFGCVNPNQIKLTTNIDPTDSAKITEDFNRQEIEQVLKDKFEATVSLPPRCFILPDGTYLSTIKDGTIYEPHYYTDNWLYKNGYIDKDEEWEYYTIRELGCITCNGFGEFYCILPVNRPTDAQLNSLGKWLDKYYYGDSYSYYNKEFKVVIPKTANLKDGEVTEARYNPKETTVDDLIKKVRRYYVSGYLEEKLNESLALLEASRIDLLNKSKNADNYSKKNQGKGKNRFDRRTKSSIGTSVTQYNNIDMDALFKRDLLTVGIEVNGETSKYIVTVKFEGVLKELANLVKSNQGKLEFKLVQQALIRVFNLTDIFIGCNCPDSKYRQRYYQWKNNYGTQYEPRPSDITNPFDSKGAACKHGLLILANLNWLIKVASVIFNYIKYCQTNMQRNYADYIFPKIYGMPYNKAVQMNLFDTGLIPSDQQTLSKINQQSVVGRDTRGRFTKDNPYAFKKKNPAPVDVSKGQLSLFDTNKENAPEDEIQDNTNHLVGASMK